MITLEYEGHFDSAHSLPDYKGKCANLHGHRWNYRITFEGKIDEDTGMLIDFSTIKNVIEKLDHQLLNKFVENPTAENISKWIYEQFPRSLIRKVELWESPNAKVVYCEEDI